MSAAPTPRILIVEDHVESARLMETLLALEGFLPRSVHDARTAYDFARCARPDLMLVDYIMPGADGLELTRWIRADPELAQTPILLCSSHPLSNDPRLQASGCDGFIAKPLDIVQLGPSVRRLLAERGRARPEEPLS